MSEALQTIDDGTRRWLVGAMPTASTREIGCRLRLPYSVFSVVKSASRRRTRNRSGF